MEPSAKEEQKVHFPVSGWIQRLPDRSEKRGLSSREAVAADRECLLYKSRSFRYIYISYNKPNVFDMIIRAVTPADFGPALFCYQEDHHGIVQRLCESDT